MFAEVKKLEQKFVSRPYRDMVTMANRASGVLCLQVVGYDGIQVVGEDQTLTLITCTTIY